MDNLKKQSCPLYVALFYLALIFWIVILLRYAFSDSEPMQQTMAQIANGKQTRWEVSLTGHTLVNYQTTDAKKAVLTIARTLHITAEEGDVVITEESNGFEVVYECIGDDWSARIKYIYVESLKQGYLSISVSMYGHMELCDDYEALVRRIQTTYELDGMVLIQYVTVLERMKPEEKAQWKEQLYERLGVKTICENEEDGYLFSYGYTKELSYSLQLGDQPVNVNVAFFDDETKGNSVIMVGFPYLPFDN